MARTIAIGDIHGCAETFFKLIEKLDLEKDDDLYLLGDYIDRGPDSKGVINTILALRENGYKVHTLRGNHEELMLLSDGGFGLFSTWIHNGGDTTLVNFGVDSFNELPDIYKNFFESTKPYIETEKYIFVHAGLNFDYDNIFDDTEAMLWARDFADVQPKLGNKILIHGHTPKLLPDILKQKGNCINVDGGCVFKNRIQKDFGYLVAIILETMEFVYVLNCEEEILESQM